MSVRQVVRPKLRVFAKAEFSPPFGGESSAFFLCQIFQNSKSVTWRAPYNLGCFFNVSNVLLDYCLNDDYKVSEKLPLVKTQL